MALRSIEPFLNLSHKYTVGSQWGYSSVLSAYNVPFQTYSGDSNNYGRGVSLELTADGWMQLSGIDPVSGLRLLAVGRTFVSMNLTFTADTVAYGGVRMKFGRSIPNQLISMQGINAMSVLAATQVPGGVVLGTEYYLEWCIDMPNNMIRTRVDGVEQVPTTLPLAARNALLANTGQMLTYGSYQTGTSNAMDIFVKDGYILEKTPDGLMSYWLGPQIVRALDVVETTGPWTATGGIPLVDSLKTPIVSAASRLTPVVISDENVSEAGFKFDASKVGSRVNGISLNVSAVKTPGKIGTLDAKFVLDANQSNVAKINPTNTMLMFNDVLLSSVPPGGGAWSKENLTNLVLKLQPV